MSKTPYINPDALLLNTSTQQAQAIREVLVPAINSLSGATPETIEDVIDEVGVASRGSGGLGSPNPELQLPADFPGLEVLREAGVETYGDLFALTDDELAAVKGVTKTGKVTVASVREAAAQTPEDAA